MHLQPFLKSAVMCNICLFNVHLKQLSMQTGKYKVTYNLLHSDYIYLIFSVLGRWTKFFKTRPHAPGPHFIPSSVACSSMTGGTGIADGSHMIDAVGDSYR